jgi:hypothetical protein
VTILLNGLSCVSARVVTPWQGVWFADVDVDLGEVPVAPTGAAVLLIGTTSLVGTIDDRASGRFGTKARVRLVGGGGGWDTVVSAQHFHNDGGVLLAAVLSATASSVGEIVAPADPTQRLGVDFVRTAGAASRVLAGLDWYVTFAGVTVVGPRVVTPALPSIEVLSFDPNTQRLELATDDVVQPGTLIVDPRFSALTVRDVEQTFNEAGSRAVAWCSSSSGSRLGAALANLARESVGVAFLKCYRYRVIAQAVDGRLTLQAVKRAAGVPDSVSIPVWPGVAGVSAKLLPGSEVLLEFIDGDASQPVVRGFQPDGEPLEIVVSAVKTTVGSAAAKPVVIASPSFVTWMAAITTAVNALAPGSAVLPVGAVATKLFSD